MRKTIKNLIWVGIISLFTAPIYADNVDVSGTVPDNPSCKALNIDSSQLEISINMPANNKELPAITDTEGFSILGSVNFNFEDIDACAYYASGMQIQITGSGEKLPMSWMSIVGSMDERHRCQSDVKAYLRLGFKGECEVSLQN